MTDREELADELARTLHRDVGKALAEAMPSLTTGGIRSYDNLSDRTRRIRHNQMLGQADAVLASDWLAAHDRALRVATLNEAADELDEQAIKALMDEAEADGEPITEDEAKALKANKRRTLTISVGASWLRARAAAGFEVSS